MLDVASAIKDNEFPLFTASEMWHTNVVNFFCLLKTVKPEKYIPVMYLYRGFSFYVSLSLYRRKCEKNELYIKRVKFF